MSSWLIKSQAIVLSIGAMAILAMTSLMLVGMLGSEQWLVFSLAVFLVSDVISGHYANERIRQLSGLMFFICVVVFFIIATNKLLVVLGILLF